MRGRGCQPHGVVFKVWCSIVVDYKQCPKDKRGCKHTASSNSSKRCLCTV